MANLVAGLHLPKAQIVLILITNAVIPSQAYEYNQSYLALRDIPQNIPQDVRGLNLAHNRIHALPNEAFGQLQQLEVLKLAHNVLTEGKIHEFSLRGTMVSSLHLENNRLSAIPRISHDLITNLYLKHNSISEIGNNALSGLPKLAIIRIDRNRISSIADQAFCGTNLNTIWLNDNNLTEVPDLSCIGGSLASLYMASNHICVIRSSDFRQLQRLSVLHIQDNCLHEMARIDVNLGHSIEFLMIQNNSLRVLAFDWSLFRHLQTMNLTDNQIHTMHTVNATTVAGAGQFPGSSALKELLLPGNNLTCFHWVGVNS